MRLSSDSFQNRQRLPEEFAAGVRTEDGAGFGFSWPCPACACV